MSDDTSKRGAAPPSLEGAAWLHRPETARVFAALGGKGGETRAVGGAVRDALLGLPVADVDFATKIVPGCTCRESAVTAVTGTFGAAARSIVSGSVASREWRVADIAVYRPDRLIAASPLYDPLARPANSIYQVDGRIFTGRGFSVDLLDLLC